MNGGSCATILRSLTDYYRSSTILELAHESKGHATSTIITNLLLLFSLVKFLDRLVAH